MDIVLQNNEKSFHFRVRGIIKNRNKFLLMCRNNADYYHIPGGHIEIGETSEEALIRELKEELGFEVRVDKLICINEAFFSSVHELVFYYLVTPKVDICAEDTIRYEKNSKGDFIKNEIKWFTANELKEHRIMPPVIKDMLVKNKLDCFTHIALAD